MLNKSARNMNIVQFEYLLLKSMEDSLADAHVEREYGSTKFLFIVDGNRRAEVIVNIRDMVMCTYCKKEIVTPGYKQVTHTGECTDNKNKPNDRASIPELPDRTFDANER